MIELLEKKKVVGEALKNRGWEIHEEDEWLIVYESGAPYLFVEVVEDINQPLEKEDQVFFTVINGCYQNSFFAQTDGVQAKIYGFYFGYPELYNDVHTIDQFLDIPADELWQEDIYRRIPDVSVLHDDKIVSRFQQEALISETTEVYWQRQFTEFINALFYETYVETGRQLPIEIIEDHCLVFAESKNASGGGYEGLHRKFIVKCSNGMQVPFVISVFATRQTKNDPVYGNRSGSTQLNIAMRHTANSSYNLQVNLNKYIDATMNRYTIWHNGVRSRLKKEYVLQTVADIADYLLDGDRVNLATFPIDKTISPKEFSTFIENIITYSYCRHLTDMKYRK